MDGSINTTLNRVKRGLLEAAGEKEREKKIPSRIGCRFISCSYVNHREEVLLAS